MKIKVRIVKKNGDFCWIGMDNKINNYYCPNFKYMKKCGVWCPKFCYYADDKFVELHCCTPELMYDVEDLEDFEKQKK